MFSSCGLVNKSVVIGSFKSCFLGAQCCNKWSCRH